MDPQGDVLQILLKGKAISAGRFATRRRRLALAFVRLRVLLLLHLSILCRKPHPGAHRFKDVFWEEACYSV